MGTDAIVRDCGLKIKGGSKISPKTQVFEGSATHKKKLRPAQTPENVHLRMARAIRKLGTMNVKFSTSSLFQHPQLPGRASEGWGGPSPEVGKSNDSMRMLTFPRIVMKMTLKK